MESEGKAAEALQTRKRQEGAEKEQQQPIEVMLQHALRVKYEEDGLPERIKHPLPIYPPDQSANFYREIFFAGFPCLHPHPSTFKDVPGGVEAVRDSVIYSGQAVLSAFQAYGPLDKFLYDSNRGMGCVVYSRGEDAESCFLSMNNAVLPGPVGDPNVKGPQEVTEIGYSSFEGACRTGNAGSAAAGTNNRGGVVKDCLIVCEFARCLPFVTPYLLFKDEYGSLELSRSLMRGFPVPENAAGANLGEWPAAATLGVPHGYKVGDSAAISPPSSLNAEPSIFIGPVFSDGPQDQRNPVFQAMFNLLKPSFYVKKIGQRLPLIELWWEYYHAYILHKTEPEPARIKSKREFLSASCPTAAQEIVSLKKDCDNHNMRLENMAPNSLLRRLAFDDVYHCTLNAILMKQKFKLDPAFASFMRDVYAEKTVLAYRAYRATHPFRPDVDAVRLLRRIEKTLLQANRGNDAAIAESKLRCFTDADKKLGGKDVFIRTSLAEEEVAEGTEKQGGSDATATSPEKEKEEKEGLTEDLRDDIAYSLLPKVQEWMTTPVLVIAGNVIENVRYLRKIKKGLIGLDGAELQRPMVRSMEEELGYPGPSIQQEDADFYDEVSTNLNGFCADGSLFSFLLLAENPVVFRSEPHHLGYEENRQYHTKGRRKFWRDCKDIVKALLVPIFFITCIVLLVNYVVAKTPAEDTTVQTYWGEPVERPSFETRQDSLRRFSQEHSASGEEVGKHDKASAGRQPRVKPTTTTTTTTTSNKEEEDVEVLSPERLAAMLNGLKEKDAKELAEQHRQAAKKAREIMKRAKEEAAKRGATFNIELSADL